MLVIISCIIFVFGSMLLGIPLVAAFLGGSLVPLSLFGSIPLNVIPAKLFSSINVYSFLAVPFFMICGGLMDKGGIAKRLVDFAKSLVGWLPGSLAVCTFVASAFFGAVSGSAVATIAAIGGIMLPLLLEDGSGIRIFGFFRESSSLMAFAPAREITISAMAKRSFISDLIYSNCL